MKTTTKALIGTANYDLATLCGRGIAEGETVRVNESIGGYRISAPGGRANGPLTWDQVMSRVNPA